MYKKNIELYFYEINVDIIKNLNKNFVIKRI